MPETLDIMDYISVLSIIFLSLIGAYALHSLTRTENTVLFMKGQGKYQILGSKEYPFTEINFEIDLLQDSDITLGVWIKSKVSPKVEGASLEPFAGTFIPNTPQLMVIIKDSEGNLNYGFSNPS